MKRLSLFLALAVAPGAAHAVDSSAGTAGATFLKFGAGSARAQALGRAYVAWAEGPDAIVWNPAGIALSEQREAGYSNLDWISDYSGHVFSLVMPLGRSVYGFNAGYFTIEEFDTRDSLNVATNEALQVKDSFLSFAIGRSFFLERLYLGLAVKTVIEDFGNEKSQNVVADIGAVFKPSDRLSIGFSQQGIGAGSEDVLDTTRVGAAMHLNDIFGVTFEIANHSDNKARPGIGVEFTVPEELVQFGRLDFRAGLASSDSFGESDNGILEALKLQRTSGVTLGMGLQILQFFGYGMTLDYAMVPMGALGTANQISLKVRF